MRVQTSEEIADFLVTLCELARDFQIISIMLRVFLSCISDSSAFQPFKVELAISGIC